MLACNLHASHATFCVIFDGVLCFNIHPQCVQSEERLRPLSLSISVLWWLTLDRIDFDSCSKISVVVTLGTHLNWGNNHKTSVEAASYFRFSHW